MTLRLRIFFFLYILRSSGIRGNAECDKSYKHLQHSNPESVTNRRQFSRKNSTTPCNASQPYLSEFEWVSRSLRPLIDGIENESCKRQMATFLDALGNSSLWAVQMFDASAKIFEIPFNSNGYQLGHFDECVDINLTEIRDSLRGKYCLVNVEIEPSEKTCSISQNLADYSCRKEDEFEPFGKRIHRVGICVPNECERSDIETFLHRYFEEILANNDMDFRIVAPQHACTTKERRSENHGGRYLGYAVLLLFGCTAFIAVFDLFRIDWKRLNGPWNRIAELFSLYRTLIRLTDANSNECPSSMSCIKVTFVIILILYRRYQLLVRGPTANHAEQDFSFHDMGLVYDALLFLTGYTAVEELSRELPDEDNRTILFVLCVKRLIRLLPLYGFVITFYAVAFEDIGSGPIWPETVGREAKRCRDMWWANLSFINNYMSVSKQCISQSWYLTVSIHCWFITSIALYLKKKRAFFGLGTFCLIVTLTVIIFVWNDTILVEKSYHEDVYIKTHNRMPSYFIGVLSAVLNSHITNSKERITKGQIVAVSSVLPIFGLFSIVTRSLSYRRDNHSEMMSALRSNLSFSLFVACTVIASVVNGIVTFKPIGLKNIFVPLDRLSYPTLLIHEVTQLYIIGTTRTAQYVSFLHTLWMGSADVLVSYAFAAFLHVIVDGPTASITEFFFPPPEKEERVAPSRETAPP